LINTTHKTNRTKVLNIYRPNFLRDKGNKSCIEALFKLPSKIKLLENIYDILFNDLPTSLEKSCGETIKALGLITIQGSHHLKNLTLLKSSFQPRNLINTNGIEIGTIRICPPTELF